MLPYWFVASAYSPRKRIDVAEGWLKPIDVMDELCVQRHESMPASLFLLLRSRVAKGIRERTSKTTRRDQSHVED
jgi:hypothetical protein